MAHGYAKNGKATKVRRPDFQLFHPGCHGVQILSSVLLTFPILDAFPFYAWRPIPSHPLFWTPRRSPAGVHPSNLLNFGRMSHPCVASNSIPSSILDAMPIALWRPSFQLSQFWTPSLSIRGGQLLLILYSGRHVHQSLASILPTFSILDACHIQVWRPSSHSSPFWTPSLSMRGVHFHLFLYSGRHGTPTAFSCWRPSFQLFPY